MTKFSWGNGTVSRTRIDEEETVEIAEDEEI